MYTNETTTTIKVQIISITPGRFFMLFLSLSLLLPLGPGSNGSTFYHNDVSFYFLEFYVSRIIQHVHFCACILSVGIRILRLYGWILFCLFIWLLMYILVVSGLGILKGSNTFQLILWSQYYTDTKDRQIYFKKRIVQTKIPQEHRCKSSEQNFSNWNLILY